MPVAARAAAAATAAVMAWERVMIMSLLLSQLRERDRLCSRRETERTNATHTCHIGRIRSPGYEGRSGYPKGPAEELTADQTRG
ncbi:hypothetical protein GCM10014715_23280 [Streptomyces spiralis]|uniref:Uncharacterized protein n=1 Tax=Streptomyces spiralis TaxID=66376 RepID=A0A918ZSZ3_9ACTN|nr:hypothetical protein GCM10014715_23280 [Streptomyces spiralis]